MGLVRAVTMTVNLVISKMMRKYLLPFAISPKKDANAKANPPYQYRSLLRGLCIERVCSHRVSEYKCFAKFCPLHPLQIQFTTFQSILEPECSGLAGMDVLAGVPFRALFGRFSALCGRYSSRQPHASRLRLQ